MKQSKGIVLFDTEFNFFKRFKSMTHAANYFEVSTSSIQSVVKRDNKLYKEIYFLFTDQEVLNNYAKEYFKKLKVKREEKEMHDLVMSSLPSKRELTKQPIIAVSMSNKKTMKFDSLTQASSKLKINKGAISDSASSPFNRKAGGLYFFKDTKENVDRINKLFSIINKSRKLKEELEDLFPEYPVIKFL